MFITPFVAAVLVGTFWAGVGTAAVVDGGALNHPRSDVVITASATDDHQSACAARYHSYRSDTDMYLGFDGAWHPCRIDLEAQ